MRALYSINLRHVALYPKNSLCEVSSENGSRVFPIISLFMNGIRLKTGVSGAMAEDLGRLAVLRRGQDVLANIRLPIDGLETGGFPCRVRQASAREVFLAFGAPLEIPFQAAFRDHPHIFA